MATSSHLLQSPGVSPGVGSSSHFTLHTLHFKLHTSNFTLQTSNFKLQTPNSKLQTSNSKLQTPNSKLQTSNFRRSWHRHSSRRLQGGRRSPGFSIRTRFPTTWRICDVGIFIQNAARSRGMSARGFALVF